jgi:hypothetical protein
MKMTMFIVTLFLSFSFLACELREDGEKACKPVGRAIMKSILVACSDPAFVSDHGYLNAADCASKEMSKDLSVFVYLMNCFFCEDDEEACL